MSNNLEHGNPMSKVKEILDRVDDKKPNVIDYGHEKAEEKEKEEEEADMAAMREAFEAADDTPPEGEVISVANKTGNDFLKEGRCNIKPLSEEARLAIKGLTLESATLEEYEEIRLAARAGWYEYRDMANTASNLASKKMSRILENFSPKKFFDNANAPYLSKEEYREREDRAAYLKAKKSALLKKVDPAEVRSIKKAVEEEIHSEHGGRFHVKNKSIHK